MENNVFKNKTQQKLHSDHLHYINTTFINFKSNLTTEKTRLKFQRNEWTQFFLKYIYTCFITI